MSVPPKVALDCYSQVLGLVYNFQLVAAQGVGVTVGGLYFFADTEDLAFAWMEFHLP